MFQRFTWIVVVGLGSLYALIAGVAIYMEPVTGDLTRLGGYLENDFGWNLPQERFARPLFALADSMDDYDRRYDVVVYGDSFSADRERGWLNYLAHATGASVILFSIEQFDLEEILASDTYERQPPVLFIYESIERNILERLDECRSAIAVRETRPDVVPLEVRPAQTRIFLESRVGQGDGGWSKVSAAVNYLRKAFTRRLLGINITEVRDFELTRAGLFSSRRDDRLLVIERDFKVANATKDDIQLVKCSLLALQARIQQSGKTAFLALMFPDKSTAYADFLANRALAQMSVIGRIEEIPELNAVPLLAPFRRSVDAGVVDFYLPNDTHCGYRAYKMAAGLVLEHLFEQGILVPPPRDVLKSLGNGTLSHAGNGPTP